MEGEERPTVEQWMADHNLDGLIRAIVKSYGRRYAIPTDDLEEMAQDVAYAVVVWAKRQPTLVVFNGGYARYLVRDRARNWRRNWGQHRARNVTISNPKKEEIWSDQLFYAGREKPWQLKDTGNLRKTIENNDNFLVSGNEAAENVFSDFPDFTNEEVAIVKEFCNLRVADSSRRAILRQMVNQILTRHGFEDVHKIRLYSCRTSTK